MALIYMDGFDAYPTAELPKRWTLLSNSGNMTVAGSSGRNGTGCLAFSNGEQTYCARSLNVNATTVIFGFAFKVGTIPTTTNLQRIAAITDLGTPQVQILINSNGHVVIVTGGSNSSGSGTTRGTFTASITTGIFYYLEVVAPISASIASNAFNVYLNGALIGTLAAGINTAPTGNAYATNVQLGGQNSGASINSTLAYDDLYVLDASGSVNNAMLGDIRVEAIRPTAAGNSTQFTAVGAASNYLAVNETSQDGDTSYVSGSTVGNLDTYTMADLSSFPSSVKAVQIVAVARKDDGGNRVIAGAIRSGGTTYDHGTLRPFSLADGYTVMIDPWDLDPNGNIPWTGTSVNALEAGVKLVG